MVHSILFLLFISLKTTYAFTRGTSFPLGYRIVHNTLYMSAISSMIKKAKLKEVEKLRNELSNSKADDSILQKFLDGKKVDDSIGEPVNFFNSTVNRFVSVTVMAEYNKKAKTGFILGMPEPEIMGGILRDAGARAIAVEMDKRSGNVSAEEFVRFAKEQTRAKLLVPGPIAVMWSDFIVDKLQIALAASSGAGAITIYPELIDDLPDFVAYCNELNIEPVVMVKDLPSAERAIAVGARSLCMHNMEEAALVELRQQLPNDRKIQYIARLRAETAFSIYSEIDTAWLLRDCGFQCIWTSSEAIYATGVSDIYSGIQAMKAKASRQFLSPRQFMMDRKKEGATEYLGEISMN